jgi:hypothetical protein
MTAERSAMLENTPIAEATLVDTPHGLAPTGEGWFIVNVGDARRHTSSSAPVRSPA